MKKKVLFIDRDGTLILEPPIDFQVDSLEKLEFYPKVIQNMFKIATEMNYEIVMVTNQDGLGTISFPEDDFWIPHNKMLKTFENEGIIFEKIFIDRTFEHENAPTRKPRTGMLKEYLNNPFYDLQNSFVIGDRVTDMELATNLGAKGILIGEPTQDWLFPNPKVEDSVVLITPDWNEIYEFLKLENSLQEEDLPPRKAQVIRKTLETQILIDLILDGDGKSSIDTGIGFFDHLLEQLAKHGRLNLSIEVKGDLHIDEHHTIEDTALALGEAFLKALGNKKGIERYGFFILPMDEALAQVSLDFSGRPYLVWKAGFQREKVGNMPTEMFEHFFKSFSDAAKCNLNIKIEGKNEHHQIEATFKAFAKAIKNAIQNTQNIHEVLSTKGVL
jgi:imidazoleglycerol-phosphate dehydratase/histidinol-phosphatase